MRLGPGNVLEDQALQRLLGAELLPDSRVLLLGTRSAVPTPPPPGTRWRLERPEDPESLDYPDETFHAAIVTSTLERFEWHRWELQQIHRVMKTGSRLFLAAPNLTAIFSPGAARYCLGKLLDRIRRYFGGARAASAARAFVGRRYLRASLERMLASLHFEVESWSSHRFLEPTARHPDRPGSAVEWGGRHFVVARKLPGLAARVSNGEPPEPREFIRSFETEHSRFVRIRDQWAARHPMDSKAPCHPLDPGSYAGAKVLVLAPHPDDELVGCGGTLLRLIEHGARVTVIQATDGGKSLALRDAPERVRTTVRLDEARAVGAALGASDLQFWKEDNRAFRSRPESVERLKRTLGELQPDLIFTPFVTDIHPDHFALNQILEQALVGASLDQSRCRILYSEIWSLVPANLCCEITPVEEALARLILMYTTAMKIDDLVHLCESRNFYHACRLLGRPGFVEAFFSAPASLHRELMNSAESHDD